MNEIDESKKIVSIIKNWKFKDKITINDDLTVDVDWPVTLYKEYLIDGKIPFQFGKVKHFSCDSLPIKSLEGCPREVVGDFNCDWCSSLTSLQGAPKEVGGLFSCMDCRNLTSLEGSPEYVGGDFICRGCKSLTSLKGAPKYIGGWMQCRECPELKSLDGLTEVKGQVHSDFYWGNLRRKRRENKKYEED